MRPIFALVLGSVFGLLVLGFAGLAHAGPAIDSDGDLVPDQWDNCRIVANGPNQGTNQVDSDLDGYGNRCDTDLDNSLTTTTADFGGFLSNFGTQSCGESDHDGSCTITTTDFAIYLNKFQSPPGAPGPSGLACASATATACTP